MKNNKLLLICGIVAGPLFVATILLEGMTRTGYNPFRDPASSLSIGQDGWMQMINFRITGILVFLFAYGLGQKLKKSSKKSFWGPLLIGLAGIGLIGAGMFTTDPLPGYPPNILKISPPTLPGQLHNFFSSFVFFGLPIATFVFTRYFLKIGKRSWALYSLLSGIGALLAFYLTAFSIAMSASPEQTGSIYANIVGLMQRITIIIIFLWITLLATFALKISSHKKMH